MTCIIGLIKNEEVFMGGDSAGIAGYSLELRGDAKVFRNGNFLIGYTSSFRMGQLLRFGFSPPKQREGQDDFEYMCTDFIDAVRERLSLGGYRQKKDEKESGGTFLVGYRGKLYKVENDFQVGIPLSDFTSCGCGEEIAYGALAVLTELNIEAGEIIARALEITERYSGGVRKPFNIISSGVVNGS